MVSDGSSKVTNLSNELKDSLLSSIGPMIAKRIISDASKIWFMFLDEKENQISVDHKSLMAVMAAVWGPRPPATVTVNLSRPDLRRISKLGERSLSKRLTRMPSVSKLISMGGENTLESNNDDSMNKNNVDQAECSGVGDDGRQNINWIPGPDSFDPAVALAKKSLEHHVVPNFLGSPEFRVYQKRCMETQAIFDKSRIASISMTSGALRFIGLGDTEWPIIPTVSLLMTLKSLKMYFRVM